jgi:UDP-glucose 4-epimerase
MMRALVTGGAGFIGSHVLRAALDGGWEVTVLDDLSTGYASNLPHDPRLRMVRDDLRDAGAVRNALVDVDAVFHLAACVGNVRSIEKPLFDAEVNLLGTLQLLEGMRAGGVRRLIYSSSAAIFGEPESLPIDERHRVEPDSPYGVTKLAAEKQCLCFGRLYGWQVACLRYFNVYGMHQRFDAYGNVIPIFGSRLLQGEPLVIYGDGEQTRDFVEVRDVARANWLALERGAAGVFNIGSGQATTIARLATMLQEASGRPGAVIHQPSRPGEVRHSVAAIATAAAALGYQPQVGLEAGLRDYMQWLPTA